MGIRGFSYTEENMKKALSVLLVVCLVFGLASCGNTGSGNVPVTNDGPLPQNGDDYALSAVAVPASFDYPNEEDFYKNGKYDQTAANAAWRDWNKQQNAKQKLTEEYRGYLDHYLSLSSEYLKGQDGKNVLCSPVNIYLALAMLAECAQGNSRAEILSVLGASDLNELRTVAKALWEQSYYDSGCYVTEMASSIWLNDDIMGTVPEYDKDTIASLAMYYYATAYSGDALDKGYSRAFKDWLDEHTGGLLKEHVEDLDDFTEDLVAAIATALYFKASWADEFNKDMTADDVFHAVAGDVTTSFMHKTEIYQVYYGDGFTAVFIPFAAAGGMWIVLPDEGVSPEKLNSDGAIFSLVQDAIVHENGFAQGTEETSRFNRLLVKMSLPKFDVDAKIDLIDILQKMGINDVFDPSASDLSGIIKNVSAYVSSATHAARVRIDEEGCEAAAFTVIMSKLTYAPSELIEFNVDRPFAFAITGSDGLPLFTGIVNDPN